MTKHTGNSLGSHRGLRREERMRGGRKERGEEGGGKGRRGGRKARGEEGRGKRRRGGRRTEREQEHGTVGD